MQEGMFSPTFWWYVPEHLMSEVHAACLFVLFLFWIGCCTRITSVLAFLITVSYSYRAQVANFGLDQINGLLALYLCIGSSGALLSVDRCWKVFRAKRAAIACSRLFVLPPTPNSVSARLATRLIQIHFCVIYAFAGLSKLQGDAWWNGEAIWLAFSNLEYQSFDMTWTAWYPWISDLATHTTIVWEVFFPVLIWVRPLRPLWLFMGFFMHIGIGVLMGMWTFGLVMIFGHLSFWSPRFMRRVLKQLSATELLIGIAPVSTLDVDDRPEAGGRQRVMLSIRPICAVAFSFTAFGLLLFACPERIDTFDEYLEVAWHHERAKEMQPAIAAYRTALQLDPAQPIAWYDLGVLLQSVGQNDEAVAAWTEAIKHNPEYVEAFVNRGANHAQQGRHDAALADYSAAITAAPEDFTARRDRAALHEDMQNLTEALADLGEALRISPRDADAWLARGLLRLKLNDFNRALVDFEQAAELDPKSVAAWHGLAQTLAHLGNASDAALALNHAQLLEPALAARTVDALLKSPDTAPADAAWAKSHPRILSPPIITRTHSDAVQFVRGHLRSAGLETESALAPWDLQATASGAEQIGQRFIVRILAGAQTDHAVAWFSAAEVELLKASDCSTTLVLVRDVETGSRNTRSGMFEVVSAVKNWKPDPAVMQPAAWSLPVAITPASAAAEPVAAAVR